MKAIRENVEALKGHRSFVAYAFDVPHFEFKWHYHPEYELTLITSGSGKRMIGDSHEVFSAGDLVLIGPDIPHTWSNQPSSEVSSAVVIQFTKDFMARFTFLPEFSWLKQLLSGARLGLHFPSSGMADKIQELPALQGSQRILALLSLLEGLSDSHFRELVSETYSTIRHADADRINIVCRYIQEKASEKVSVIEASALVHLSPSAFCKFFKRHMGRGFSDYVNDIRIADACLQLLRTEKNIREIASDSGFESLTYFNRVFRKKRGTTPSNFRKNTKTAF